MGLMTKCFYTFLMVSQVIGILAFLLGFYPVKKMSLEQSSLHDLPAEINQLRINPSDLYVRHIDKVILMIVDGLRYDFVNGKNSVINMPYVSSVINHPENCLLKVKVETPTVTMPRIKALMTGYIPGFLDVLNNFKTSAVLEDNLLRQATEHGLISVFYGDETWVRLFPDEFKRIETTTSFFVNDFYEVDNNVTRNLEKELSSSDWDIMVLHYLGLDHIGHAEGPKSHFIKPKLMEMDKIIKKINDYIIQKKTTVGKKGEKVVLVVCGDHGMRDTGGHGGSTLHEVIVPFFLINHGCDTHLRNEEVNQIDFVPLMAVMLGLPIPTSNLGKLDYRMLRNLSPMSRLYVMHYSTSKLQQNLEKTYLLNSNTYSDFMYSIQEAEHLFEKWVGHSLSNYENLSLHHYFEAQKLISEEMIKLSISYDFYVIFIAILMLLQIWWILLNQCFLVFNKKRILMSVCCYIAMIFGNNTLCSYSLISSFMCSDNYCPKPLPNIIAIIISFNMFFASPLRRRLVSLDADLLLLFPFLLHLLSYASSSYIEEEHQFWYFFFTTTCLYIIISRPTYSCVVTLIAHRFLRKLNQTGDKWASLPDIGDWLNEEQSEFFLLFAYFSGQLALMYWCSKNLIGKHTYGWRSLLEILFFLAEIVMMTVYRFSIKNLKIPGLSLQLSRGITDVKFFWILLICQLILYFVSFDFKSSKRKFMVNSFDVILIILLEIVALLHKPHNVLLIPALLFFLDVLTKFFSSNIYHLTILYQSIGMVFFFYQGNSNGLGTVDVTSGFIGLEEFNLLFSGFYVFINTFSSIILSNILLLRLIFLHKR